MKKFLLVAAACAVPLMAFAAPSASPGADPARMREDIKVLSSDAFEGRAPNSAGEEKTVAYLVEQLKKIGAQPGGDLKDGQRAWTQDVPLSRFEIVGKPVLSATINGLSRPLTQGEDVAIRAAMTNVDQVTFANAPLVFLGYGVKAPERNWDDFKGVDLKGKIAVVLINDPDFEGGEGDFGGKAMTYYGRWTYKYEEAARQGALGLIIVHETEGASYGWATVTNSNTNEMFDIVRKDPSASHPTVEGWMQRPLAVELFKAAGLDFEAQKAAARTRGFKPVELKGVTLSGDYKVKHEEIVSKNVVALLPGKTRPDETVMYTAHWDHIGVGAPDATGDRIYNGAVDNATGAAGLLELARLYKAAGPTDRSVAFLWVTAEEKGLLGSEYYAANPLYPLATTAGVLNADGMNVATPTKDFTISGSTKLELLDLLTAEAAKAGRAYTPDPNTYAGYFFRSDHFSLAKRGVPAISFGGGQDRVEGGVEAGKADAEAYRKDRYHQQADNFDPSWPLTGMAADIGLLYRVGRDLANSTQWPEWGAGVEFKAARDATKAERK
ncbi:MAG: M28 family metallopeptidase [Pseudomonadota bacterium]